MRKLLLAGGVVVALVGFLIFWEFRPAPGVEIKGDEQIIAWLGLASAIVGLLTALVGLATAAVQNRRGGQ